MTIHANVFGVDWTIPVFEYTRPSQQSHATASGASTDSQPAAARAPSAEVAELQRRLAASGDADVIGLMTSEPDQLDPLDARGISRWLQAKGRDMDLAEEHIHTHAKWRQAFMPAGHIPEV